MLDIAEGTGEKLGGQGGRVVSSDPRRCSHISRRYYHPRFSHTFFGNLPFLRYRVNVDTFGFTRFGSRRDRVSLNTKATNLTRCPPVTNNETVSGFEHGRKTRHPTITALLSTPPFFHHQSTVFTVSGEVLYNPGYPGVIRTTNAYPDLSAISVPRACHTKGYVAMLCVEYA